MDSTLMYLHGRIYKWEAMTTVFGCMCFMRVLSYVASIEGSGEPIPIAPELLFFLLVSFSFLVFSSMMMLSSFIVTMCPEEGGEKVQKSLFEVLLYGCGGILYFFATVCLIIYLFFNPAEKEWTLTNVTFVITILFSIYNTVGYAVSCYASEKCRQMMLLNKSSLSTQVDQTV